MTQNRPARPSISFIPPTAVASLTLLAAFGLAPGAHAQWVRFENQTATRMPVGPGLNTAALSTTDVEEKDYAWGDVNKDGWIDLVVVRKQPFTSTGRRANVLFMNEGIAHGHAINGILVDRTAQYATASTVPGDQGFLTPTNDRDVVLVDVNNDTWLDIVTATTLSDGQPFHISHPRVYINLGEVNGVWQGFRYEHTRIPNMVPPPPVNQNATPRFCSVAAGDLTGNGFVDLYFGDYDSGGSQLFDFNNKLLINQGSGNPGFFTDSGTTRMSANPGLISAFGAASVIADINGDGWNDVVKQTSLSAPTHVAVQHNNPGNPGFFPDPVYKVVYSNAPYHVSAGDLNNDGRLDLVISDDGADRYLLNTGNAANGTANFQSFTFSHQLGGDQGFGSNSIIVDLNNDGWNDVLIADVDVDISGCSRRTQIYRNLGNAPNVTLQEQSPSVIPTNMLTGTHDIAAFDINNDGWVDLVIGRCTGTQVWMNIPPAGLAFSYPDGLPGYLTPNAITTFTVKLTAVSGTVMPNSGQIHVSENGGPFVQFAMPHLGNNVYSATLPALACTERVRYYFSGQLSSGAAFTDPPQAPANSYSSVAALGAEITLREEFENKVNGWTVWNDPSLTGGAWEVAEPNGTINAGMLAAPYEDATAGASNVKAFVTENGPSNSTNPSNWDVDGGPTILISPTLDLAGTDATISFASWFYTSVPAPGETLNVGVSNNNGGTWTEVMAITHTAGDGGGNTAWVNKSFVVGDFVMPTSTVRVRFSVADIGTPSIVEAGIDNFTVEEIICTPTPTCHGDITGDNLVNVNDLLAVINAWGPCPPSVPCPADFVPPGGDGVVNVNDLLGVINAWGPCGK